jgi:hypothetical protein
MYTVDETIEMDSSVAIAFTKGEIESLTEDIKNSETKKKKLLDAFNNTISDKIVLYFELIFGEEADINADRIVNWNFQINSSFRIDVNKRYSVHCPYNEHRRITLPDLEFSFYQGWGERNYQQLLDLKDFCDTLIQHMEVFTLINQFIDEQLPTFNKKIEALNEQISLLKDTIKECRMKIRNIRIKTLLSGRRIMFYNRYGKKLHTTCKRPENYRWIEITAMSISRNAVDIRGVIFVEEKNLNGFNVYYTLTKKEKLFERKNVRIKTLLNSVY